MVVLRLVVEGAPGGGEADGERDEQHQRGEAQQSDREATSDQHRGIPLTDGQSTSQLLLGDGPQDHADDGRRDRPAVAAGQEAYRAEPEQQRQVHWGQIDLPRLPWSVTATEGLGRPDSRRRR